MLSISAIKNLSNSELLRVLNDLKNHSPIISELCTRLENSNENLTTKTTCPVCMASLSLDVDHLNHELTIEINK